MTHMTFNEDEYDEDYRETIEDDPHRCRAIHVSVVGRSRILSQCIHDKHKDSVHHDAWEGEWTS